MKSFLLYTVARLAVFLLCWGLVWLVSSPWLEWNDVTALWTALVAVVVSGVVSYVVLRPLRERMALEVQAGSVRMRARYDAARRREDVDD
ncbi:MAG: DUF4229 domain-containing protein [Actinomycetota bacterium]|nr:DUF4229 domain-containing protein [Actinomycetota bacterium]